jgi:hypothetical protein
MSTDQRRRTYTRKKTILAAALLLGLLALVLGDRMGVLGLLSISKNPSELYEA